MAGAGLKRSKLGRTRSTNVQLMAIIAVRSATTAASRRFIRNNTSAATPPIRPNAPTATAPFKRVDAAGRAEQPQHADADHRDHERCDRHRRNRPRTPLGPQPAAFDRRGDQADDRGDGGKDVQVLLARRQREESDDDPDPAPHEDREAVALPPGRDARRQSAPATTETNRRGRRECRTTGCGPDERRSRTYSARDSR